MAIDRENWLRSVVPAGTVIAFAGATPPSGWLLCDGSAISRSTYSALFTAISTAHGSGDGSTTFTLPDYRGRFLRGVANGSTNDPDRASRTHPVTGAVVGDTVGSVQDHANASHFHYTFNTAESTFSNTPSLRLTASEYPTALDSSGVAYSSYNIDGTATPATVGKNSDSGGNESRPRNANVNYIIKA